MHSDDPASATWGEETFLSVDELASACAVSTDWVVRHLEDGVLFCAAGTAVELRFSSRELGRARRIRMLERDFDADPELAALVADVFDELDVLRRRLRRAGLDER